MKKLSLILLSSILFTSCGVFKNKKITPTEKQIVIIGAGISGLSAAKHLKSKGYNPIILEAQAKVGGRLKTDRSLGIAFDEGASWIHGPIKNPITQLAKESGMQTFLTKDESVVVFDINGTKYANNVLEEEEETYNNILKKLNGNKNLSFAAAFYKQYPNYKNNRLWTYMLSAFLEFDTGGDIYKLSSKDFYDDETFKGEDIIATNGYDNIANYLAKGLDIRLNNRVTEIDYSGDKTLIKTDSQIYSADIVLITVPLGVLKKGIIQFNPKLPTQTQNAIDKIEMGAVNKFLLVWDKSFWNEDLQYIGYTPKAKGKFNYFLNIKKFVDTNALMTFAFGDYSKTTEKMEDDAIIEEVMGHLRVIYGKNIPKPKQMLRTKWNTNPYSYGAYSFSSNGISSDAFKIFESPVAGKLFFAGEHTILEYRGTVHGAYLSGIREAKKIVKIK